MSIPKIEVNAVWDNDAKVWVAESDDVPGLITEAATLDILFKKLSTMVPELLEANGVITEGGPVPFDLIAHGENISARE